MEDVRYTGDAAQAKRVVSLARTLLSKGDALESTNSGERIDRARLAEALERRVEMNAASSSVPPSLTAKATATEVLTNAESALSKTAGGASPANLTDLEIASLEAIIEVTGRPAMRYSDGRVEMPPTALGENDSWRVLIAIARWKINDASASVGRISITSNAGVVEHIGTGWRTADDWIVTNRHVVKEIAKNPDDSSSSWTIASEKHPFIDFAATDNAATTQRFQITEMVYCAEENYVDVALLRVTSGADKLPPPLTMNWDLAASGRELAGAGGEPPRFQGSEIYVVGHPYRQHHSELVAAVFGTADGNKRWSPGFVVYVDAEKPVFEHDCSTLGGHSGSCVFAASSHAVIGIHMAGVKVNETTGQGSANLAVALSRLSTHRAAEILRKGKI